MKRRDGATPGRSPGATAGQTLRAQGRQGTSPRRRRRLRSSRPGRREQAGRYAQRPGRPLGRRDLDFRFTPITLCLTHALGGTRRYTPIRRAPSDGRPGSSRSGRLRLRGRPAQVRWRSRVGCASASRGRSGPAASGPSALPASRALTDAVRLVRPPRLPAPGWAPIPFRSGGRCRRSRLAAPPRRTTAGAGSPEQHQIPLASRPAGSPTSTSTPRGPRPRRRAASAYITFGRPSRRQSRFLYIAGARPRSSPTRSAAPLAKPARRARRRLSASIHEWRSDTFDDESSAENRGRSRLQIRLCVARLAAPAARTTAAAGAAKELVAGAPAAITGVPSEVAQRVGQWLG